MGSTSLTTLLIRCREGDPNARHQLVATVYPELRRLARRYMQQERPDHTLQATAVVNELYLRLFTSEPVQWQDKAHFFAVAAKQLRHILVNHARDRVAKKRGGKRIKVSLSDVNSTVPSQVEDMLDLHEALNRLEEFDPRAAHLVELRFFAGLTEREAADVLGISVSTLKRDWDFVRAWLIQQLRSK